MKDREIKPYSTWRHFKGFKAFVICVAEHTETKEKLVIYHCSGNDNTTTHTDGIYARPIEMFLSKVDKDKYPDVSQEYRFEKISD